MNKKSHQLLFVLCLFGLIFLINSCSPKEKKSSKKNLTEEIVSATGSNNQGNQISKLTEDFNHLSTEKSPYLLQHADNPVHWYPWGKDAFAKAKKEDKPIFLSIGYSTCHWCHVMEKESFEKSDIADVMNKYFVSIKVDREERSDIDNIYMQAVMSMTGSGGWPLSIFLTPDKKPFYGGTYFPPKSQWGRPGFKELLLSINDSWQNKRDELLQTSQKITESLQRETRKVGGSPSLDVSTLQSAYNRFVQRFDQQYGGFGRSPKFPSSHNLSFLLRYWKRAKEDKALDMVETTLTKMAQGGIYDHLGGGFHRYSTDRYWLVPHFEKMLYDQAILSKTYLEAYQATGKEQYAQVAREIFDYVLRDMRDPKGGLYSAEDADSYLPEDFIGMTPDPSQHIDKKEGAFYLWSQQEILKIVDKEKYKIFNYYFGVQPNGNINRDPRNEFGNKNILSINHSLEETASYFQKPQEEIREILSSAKGELFSKRADRPRPHLDDKVLVDWNGLMISSLAFGSRVLNEPRYRDEAEKAAQFILQNLVRKDGRLLHRYRDGESAILGTIEDYAFFIHGLIDLYESTFKVEYLKEAKRLTQSMIDLFWDEKDGGFFFTGTDAEELLIRQKEIYDGALPSGNSIAALDLIRLAHLTLNRDLEKRTKDLFQTFAQQGLSSSQLLIALDFAFGPSKEIVIAGEHNDQLTQEMIKTLYNRFLPNKVVVFRPANDNDAQEIIAITPFVKNQPAHQGKTTAYVCENYICKLPTSDLKQFKLLLEEK